MGNRTYIAIDLKSFYASVECVERGLDPLDTNLVVADSERTEKTICLAVSPSLKAYGISGRARLFQVVQKVGEVNIRRAKAAPGGKLAGASSSDRELKANPILALDYIVARPQMAHYMQCSAQIYNIYLKYAAPEDIHVYSVDEVFIDATGYLGARSPREFAREIIQDVLRSSGITATAGIGTNLYLCKIAMDIVAKHIPPDENGVRIAELDESAYRRLLWGHRPLTDFWRVGRGYTRKLEANGLFTMGDIARCSLENEELLYSLFGVNAELLIDHAWGWESCTIGDIKDYRPESNSTSSGQVLQYPYDFEKGKLIVREMTDLMALDLVEKGLVTDQMVLTVGYDIENLTDPKRRRVYKGPVTTDGYGRKIPKQAHGSISLGRQTASAMLITNAVMELYDRIVDAELLIRRVYVAANHVVREGEASPQTEAAEQLDLFTDYEERDRLRAAEEKALDREKRRQEAILSIRKKYGKNAILKGMNLEEGATTVDRNNQIGGHRA